jgi:hypothetical protein
MRQLLRWFAVAVATATVSLAAAETYGAGWSTIGASGIPVSATEWMVQYNYQPTMSLRSSVGTGTALVKYNVIATPDVTNRVVDQPNLCLWVTFRADTSAARVRATLYRVRFDDSAPQVLDVVDSDAHPANGQSGYRTEGNCMIGTPDNPAQPAQTLDFLRNAYYVEVELTRRDSTGNPGIKALGIGHDTP